MSGGIREVPGSYDPPFQRALGITMAIGPAGEGIARVTIDPELHLGSRWVHGGLVGTLVDVASGITIAYELKQERNVLDGTVELKVNFLRRAYEGDLVATATLVHMGSRTAVTECDVVNGDRLVAKALATFMLSREAAAKRAAEREDG